MREEVRIGGDTYSIIRELLMEVFKVSRYFIRIEVVFSFGVCSIVIGYQRLFYEQVVSEAVSSRNEVERGLHLA